MMRSAQLAATLAALVALASISVAAGCGESPGPAPNEAPWADRLMFDAVAAPVLEEQCANPTCHGGPWRPLALYAPRLYRMDPADVHLDGPLNDDEQTANFERVRGFLLDVTSPERCLLVTKPLSQASGGVFHGGGSQYEDSGERGYQALVSWVRTCLEGRL